MNRKNEPGSEFLFPHQNLYFHSFPGDSRETPLLTPDQRVGQGLLGGEVTGEDVASGGGPLPRAFGNCDHKVKCSHARCHYDAESTVGS